MEAREYQYEPLDTSSLTIRLISYVHSRDDGSIAFRLQRFPFEKVAGTYTAISYTWGAVSRTQKVWINRGWMMLPENIWRFLVQCCKASFQHAKPRRLWIDSICIDQSDVTEKNTHVRYMGDIFHHASKVLIWLGSVSESLMPLSETEQSSQQSSPRHASLKSSSVTDAQDRVEPAQVEQAQIQRLSIKPAITDNSVHQGFSVAQVRSITNHSYWTRLWVVQEIVLGRDPRIVAGNNTLPLTTLRAIVQHWRGLVADVDSSGYMGLDFLYERSSRNDMAQTWQLNDLLAFCNQRRCYDIRDRIYGLVGMWKGSEGFQVDYECTTGQLAAQMLVVLKEEASSDSELHGFNRVVQADYLRSALEMNVAEFVTATSLAEKLEGEARDLGIDDQTNYIISLGGRYWYDKDHHRYRFARLGMDAIPAEVRQYWDLLLQRGYSIPQVLNMYSKCKKRAAMPYDDGSYQRHWWQIASKGACTSCGRDGTGEEDCLFRPGINS